MKSNHPQVVSSGAIFASSSACSSLFDQFRSINSDVSKIGIEGVSLFPFPMGAAICAAFVGGDPLQDTAIDATRET